MEVGAVLTGVNDSTMVHIVETKEDLLYNLANEMLWDAVWLVTLDQVGKVFTEDFENNADVGEVGACMTKVI